MVPLVYQVLAETDAAMRGLPQEPLSPVVKKRSLWMQTMFAFLALSVAGCASMQPTPKEQDSPQVVPKLIEESASRPISIVLGSAPKELVSRYVASFAYGAPDGKEIWGRKEVGPDGGVLFGTLLPADSKYPDSVTISVTTDYAPGSQIQGSVQAIVVPVTDTGVNFLFEPQFQDNSLLRLVFTLPKRSWWRRVFERNEDYLILSWTQVVQAKPITRFVTLVSEVLEIRPLVDVSIPLMQSPEQPTEVILDVAGRYNSQDVRPFSTRLDLTTTKALSLTYKYDPDCRSGEFSVNNPPIKR